MAVVNAPNERGTRVHAQSHEAHKAERGNRNARSDVLKTRDIAVGTETKFDASENNWIQTITSVW